MQLVDFLTRVKCGGLEWLCCLQESDIEEAHAFFSSYSPDQVKRLRRYACACAAPTPIQPPATTTPALPPPGGGGGGGGATTLNPCLAKLRDYLCSPIGQGALTAFRFALTTAGSFLPDAVVQYVPVAVAVVTEILEKCGQPPTSGAMDSAIKQLCAVLVPFQDGVAALPEAPREQALSLMGGFSAFNPLGALARECCGSI